MCVYVWDSGLVKPVVVRDDRCMPTFRWMSYVLILVLLTTSFWISRAVPNSAEIFSTFPEGLYLAIAFIFAIGYGSRFFSRKTIIPSFVLATLMGVALQPFFVSLTSNLQALSIINEFLAALILFGSGVEMPWVNFKKYLGPVASLAFFGMLLSALIFALILEFLARIMGIEIPASSVLLIGSILAAVEPSAIIPIFKNLRFTDKKIRDVAIAEGAVNDVTGTVITRFFLVATVAALTTSDSVLSSFWPLVDREYLDAFALEIIWGIAVGVVGAKILEKWYNGEVSQRDNPALFFAIPMFCYAMGGIVGGSGYLAAFVAGLLYQSTTTTRSVAHFFETFNSHLVVPIIFVLLGAVIPLSALNNTMVIGLIAAFLFMFVVRPLVVLISLSPWLFGRNPVFTWAEYIFLSFIRETGGVSAVLILIIASQGIAGTEYIFGIGFWVIIMTLMVEPPLTPWLTQKLGLAEPIDPVLHHLHGQEHEHAHVHTHTRTKK